MTYSKNNKPTKALVLAAGFGSRLKPLTDYVPKCLVEVGGKPIIDRVIDQIKAEGIKDIYVNTHYLAEKVCEYLKSRKDVNITISHEPEILETGGGVLKVLQQVGEPLLVVSADNVLGGEYNAIAQVLERWNVNQMNFLVALKNKYKSNTYAGKGDYSLADDGKLSYSEPKNYIFVGAYIVAPEFFKGWNLGKFRIPDVILKSSNDNNNKNYGTITEEDWFDIGTPDYLKIANSYFEKRK